MGNRLELQSMLEELFGNKNVYYQPPKSIMMSYPAIMYFKKNPSIDRANDSLYKKMNCYEVFVIDKKPDNPVIDKLLYLPYCSFDRPYKSDNLYHDVFTLYY
jgi:hypothetical protein